MDASLEEFLGNFFTVTSLYAGDIPREIPGIIVGETPVNSSGRIPVESVLEEYLEKPLEKFLKKLLKESLEVSLEIFLE